MSESNGTVATVSAVTSHQCFIVRSGNSIKIISPNREKTCDLNSTLINISTGISDDEIGFIERITDGLVDGIEDRLDLTKEEMEVLVGIREKSNSYQVKSSPIHSEDRKEMVDHVKSTMEKIHSHTVNGEERKAVNTLNATERRIISLKKTVDIYQEEFYQVEYDIPEKQKRTKDNPKGVENPSDWFWKHAMRLTKSCWCFPESSFKHAEVAQWLDNARERKCKIRVIPYARRAIESIKEMAVEELRETMVLYHTNMVKNIICCDDRLNKAIDELNEKVLAGDTTQLTASREQRAAEDYRNNQVRNHLRNAADRLKMGTESAERFDLYENVSDLFQAFRATIDSQVETFNAMARMRGVLQVEIK